jgi:nucleoside-diphosphate-sugar epimerase
VSGNAQINLIDAAANTRVRRFVPSEFEGTPSRQKPDDALDRGKAVTRDRLRYWSHRTNMRSTVFTCGVFYERFARGGLASMGIGASTGVYYQGTYLMDIGQGTAEVTERNTSGHSIHISMISVNDVGRFLAAAIELGLRDWPSEFRMAGDRQTVAEILSWAETVRGGNCPESLI